MQLWRNKTDKVEDNRINVIMSIIFLLAGGVLFKLFSLQVLDKDLYITRAMEQHQVRSDLEPQRGRIFIQDGWGGEKELYPLASNKKFALLYAIPEEMENAPMIAEALYAVFDEEHVLKEVEGLLEKEDQEVLAEKLADVENLPEEARLIAVQKILDAEEEFKSRVDYIELRKARIEEEIKKMKAALVGGYEKKLTKEDDPYEPLEQKVPDDKLKSFYARLLTGNGKEILPEDLEIKDDKLLMAGADGKQAPVEMPGLDFLMKIYRYYPENSIGSNMLGFVSYADDKAKGQYGLEGFFNEELTGAAGSIKTDRSAGGQLIIVNDREYEKAKNGTDLVLTIERTIQFEACRKLSEAVEKHGADSGSVIIIEPESGAILAMCSSPDFDGNNYRDVEDMSVYNNPVIFGQYEPGSIFKALTMAMGLDQEKITPETTFNDTGVVKISKYEIKNSDKKAYGVVNMNRVLEESLNTGSIFVMRKVGPDNFTEYVKNFGFGEKTGIELEGESAGNINSLTKEKMNKELYAATASFGQGITVTPLQMVSAFGAIANGGMLVKPHLVKEMVNADGQKIETQPKQIRRVISERASMILGGMLVNVVENGHGKRAGVKGYYVAGKTGTAQVSKGQGKGYEENAHIGSFAGFAPANDPAFAMLVRIDNPRDVEWAESSAAPLFGDIAEFLLNYLQIPTERPIK